MLFNRDDYNTKCILVAEYIDKLVCEIIRNETMYQCYI